MDHLHFLNDDLLSKGTWVRDAIGMAVGIDRRAHDQGMDWRCVFNSQRSFLQVKRSKPLTMSVAVS